jgi:hypothetical protein
MGPVNGSKIKALTIVALWVALASLPSNAKAGTLFTNPVIVISPKTIDFGVVPLKTTVTNTVLVENWGGGKLVGKATVPRPFKIISGGSYRLGQADAQVVTVTYTPSGAPMDTNVVKFTGGAGTILPVVGKPASQSPDSAVTK